MLRDDYRPIKYVARRAYQLAQTGEYEDFAAIEQVIVDEGYAEYVAWLERPCVIEALQTICEFGRAVPRDPVALGAS